MESRFRRAKKPARRLLQSSMQCAREKVVDTTGYPATLGLGHEGSG